MQIVKTALSFGLATVFLCLRQSEVGSIVLAGVSAQTTWEILEKAPWVFTVGWAADHHDPGYPSQ